MNAERARFESLASLPIPSTVPDDVLQPIIIPAPFTIHEFLGNTSGVSCPMHYGSISLNKPSAVFEELVSIPTFGRAHL